MGWSCPISGRSPGTSLGSVFVSSIDDCKASCESIEGCYAITFRKSTGLCWRLDRFYDSKYEKASDDAMVANYGIDQRCDVFTKAAAPGQCLKTTISDIGVVLRNSPHTIQVRLSFPNNVPTVREWILNLGQRNTGSHHWIWQTPSSGNSQIGKWGGPQISNDISGCTYLTTTFSGSVLKLYCDGIFMAQKNAQFSINSARLSIGTIGFDADFAGCISEVSIFKYEKSADQIARPYVAENECGTQQLERCDGFPCVDLLEGTGH